MTQNQISFAKVEEDKRHNQEMEQLTKAQNKLTKEQVESQKAHYERSDAYTDAHYQRSDAASMVSANAAAMNADTNKKQYLLSYALEYGDQFGTYTGTGYYPMTMPLSAQLKNAEIEYYKTGSAQREADIERLGTQSQLNEAQTRKTEVDTQKSQAETAGTVLNALFGKGGLYSAIETMVFGPKSRDKG